MGVANYPNHNQAPLVPAGAAMNSQICRKSAIFQILNDKGLHTRPATELVKTTSRYKARAHLTHQSMTVNAKSLLGILMLAAAKGAKITIEAEGPDAHELVQAVLQLANDKFNICY